MWLQKEILLQARPRGFHLVTQEIVRELPELARIKTGLLQVFIKHTSASLTINENADPAVRRDFETFFSHVVPQQGLDFRHDDEGPDDLPAHIKSSLLGASVIIPVSRGQLSLGTWQGIYLCEHRNHGGARTVVLTLAGEVSDR
ncbi:MAG TPA: secondary thiamine-phosphate synthase enzyme YjbQ [Halioglobus sp.]